MKQMIISYDPNTVWFFSYLAAYAVGVLAAYAVGVLVGRYIVPRR